MKANTDGKRMMLGNRKKHVPKSRSLDVGIKDKNNITESTPANNWDEGIETFVNVKVKRPTIKIDTDNY